MTASVASFAPVRRIRSWGGAIVALLACAPLALAAPAAQAKSMAGEGPDVFGGYTYVRAGEAGLSGWHLSGSIPFWRSIRLVADLSGHYGSFAGAELSQLTLMVGGRRYWHAGPLRPFAELLVGGVRHEASFATPDGTLSSAGTDLAVSPGIGVDYRFDRTWSARAAVDLVLVHGGAWEVDPRLSIGVAHRFGQR